MMPAQRAFRCGQHALVTGHIGANGSCLSLMRTSRRPGFHLKDLFTLALLRPWSRLDHHTSADALDYEAADRFHLGAQELAQRGYRCPQEAFRRTSSPRLICYRRLAASRQYAEMTENLPRALNFGLPPENSLRVRAVVGDSDGFGPSHRMGADE